MAEAVDKLGACAVEDDELAAEQFSDMPEERLDAFRAGLETMIHRLLQNAPGAGSRGPGRPHRQG